MSKKNTATAPEANAPASQWMILADRRVFSASAESKNAQIISFPHPRTGDQARCMVSADGKEVFEVGHLNTANTKNMKRSWLVGDSVQKDGSYYVVGRIDPIFLILPVLQQHSTKKSTFATLEDIFTASGNSNYHRLERCSGLSGLRHICDTKEACDITAYRLNNDKLLAWLAKKINRLVEVLAQTQTNVGNAAQSDLLVLHSEGVITPVTDAHRRYAVALMGDYLPDPLTTELAQHIGIDMKKHEVRAKSVTAIEKDEKSIRGKSAEGVKQTGGDNPTADYTKLNSKATTAKKQRVVKGRSAVLKKINTRGMKSLGSYFSK